MIKCEFCKHWKTVGDLFAGEWGECLLFNDESVTMTESNYKIRIYGKGVITETHKSFGCVEFKDKRT